MPSLMRFWRAVEEDFWLSAPKAMVAPRQAVEAKKERRFNIIQSWCGVMVGCWLISELACRF